MPGCLTERCYLTGAHVSGFCAPAAFGVFLSFFLDRDYFPGATRLHYAFIGGLQVGMALLTSPGANYGARHFVHIVASPSFPLN